MENFEQLKRQMMWSFENKPEIPAEILQVIQKMFNQLEEKYKDMRCNSSTIQEYMRGKLDELVVTLEGQVGTKRKDERFEDIQGVLVGVEQDIEERLTDEEQKIRDNKRQYQISEIGNNGNDIRTSINTVYIIEDTLRDVQSRQNRILQARGLLSERQIQEVNQEVTSFISQLRNRSEEKIHLAYKEDDIQLRQELLEIYQNYALEREEEQHTKEVETRKNEFRKGLTEGAPSLEEQKSNSEMFVEKSQAESDKSREEYRQSLEAIFK